MAYFFYGFFILILTLAFRAVRTVRSVFKEGRSNLCVSLSTQDLAWIENVGIADSYTKQKPRINNKN